MKQFMDEKFMLNNPTSIELYDNYAKDMPIYDYHCHLNPKEIWENKRYENITQMWLYGDHYKWRAMRSNGIEEEYITGSASDFDKFFAYAKTVQHCIGNPLYHWTHLELKRYFGIDEVISEKTALNIWEKANEKLKSEGFSVREIIKSSNVKIICTTDDPADSLEYHINIKNEGKMDCLVLPTFRPDKAIEINKVGFADYIKILGNVCGADILSVNGLLSALESRVYYFHENGCRISDNGFDYVPFRAADLAEVEGIFKKAMCGSKVEAFEEEKYKTFILQFLGRLYAKLGWTMQLHIGALRNNNTAMFEKIGADTGFDSIHDLEIAYSLSKFLDSLNLTDELPKTILYTLNPKDNYVLGTMLGNFQGGGIPGKMQFGSAWWFNDQRDGMVEQMKALANLGLLSKFVGMLTDSRSFLSYTRHEYFRRILCNLLGEWVENGEFPKDMDLLGDIVKNICFYNADRYFKLTD